MKQKLIVLLGLPGSGKSTWAKKQTEENPETHIRVCRDDIRSMLGPYWVPSRENLVTKIEQAIVDVSIHKGYSVIIDATNFGSFNKWKQFTKDIRLNFEIKSFMDVPLDVCISRDQQREKPVGKAVINRMYESYLTKGIKYE